MEFQNGVNVFTAEGDKVGSIERVVVDPRMKEITHVIVKQGFLFTEDKVLPIDLIATATDEQVTLKEDVNDLEAMPEFEETQYVTASVPGDAPPSSSVAATRFAWPMYYLPPNEPGKQLIPHWNEARSPRYVSQTNRNVPEDAVTLEDNAKVISADGDHVGNVAKVFTNAENDCITHLLVSRGILFKEERLIPVEWIDKVGEGTLNLAVESALLNRLQPYLADRLDDNTTAGS